MGRKDKHRKKPLRSPLGEAHASHAHHPGRTGSKEGTGEPPRRSWLATHGRDLRFLFIFAVLIGLYYVLTTTAVARQDFFPWYLRLNAWASVRILNYIGYDDVSVRGQSMVSPQFSIQIERGCDAVEPSALFVVAVLASPVRFRRKIPAVVLGTVLLLIVNVIRIVTLYLTGLHFRRLFDTMHLDVWQAAFIFLAILLWAVWASRVVRTRARQPDATA